MASLTHLEALKNRHRSLEEQLAEALSHASVSDLEIAGIKQKKLLLKDQITSLEAKIRSAFS